MKRFYLLLIPVLCMGLNGAPPISTIQTSDPLPPLGDPTASDEIYNEGASAPVVSFSLIQGGLSDGTVDGGNTIDDNSLLEDYFGSDLAIGTEDDRLVPTGQSPVVDAGDNSLMPADRFDLDQDGNTWEPVPFDAARNQRRFDGSSGAAVSDMGAYEYGAPIGTYVEEESITGTTLEMPFPNPVSDVVNVRARAGTTGKVEIQLLDVLGRRVRDVYSGEMQLGERIDLVVPTQSLASGVYLIRLVSADTEMYQRFILAR